MKKSAGIYIHIPFCRSKCPYCDFYSHAGNEEQLSGYTAVLTEKISEAAKKYELCADSLYFGGGTPGLLGAERLCGLIGAVRDSFGIADGSEVTVEVNPCCNTDFELLRRGGANRISIGVQSANDNELKMLGRQHDRETAAECIRAAANGGFDNISLDLMLGIPFQTKESLRRSVDFCAESGASHISAYLLKIEEGTVFHKKGDSLPLPDEDEAAELYEELCALMKEYGYEHYEISNFCKKGFEGRHNLKYWHDEEYLGIGPSAHSFINGKRFYYPRNMKRFYADEVIDDGTGGDEEEFIMLGLRLSEGITRDGFFLRFGRELPEKYIKRARVFTDSGLVRITEDGFALTENGFLVSNSLIAEIIG